MPAKDPGGPPAKFLPPAMYALFRPRPPLEFKLALTKRKMPPPTGIANFINHFETEPPPKRICSETVKQKHARLLVEKIEANKETLKEKVVAWETKKKENKDSEGDAYKTLFVARVSYDVSEKKLRREFERFGPIKKITMIKDNDGQFRGYCFIQYESEKCMRDAYKRGDGTKLNGRRVLVDVERGRTVRGWKPRKLGGGLGETRVGDSTNNKTHSGRAPTQSRYQGSSSRPPSSSTYRGAGGGGSSRPSGSDRRSGGDDRRDRDRRRDPPSDRRGDRGSERRDDRGGERRDRDRRSDRGGDRDRRSDRGGDRDRRSDRGRESDRRR